VRAHPPVACTGNSGSIGSAFTNHGFEFAEKLPHQ